MHDGQSENHALQDCWRLMYSKRGKQSIHTDYKENLETIAQFDTLERFLQHYHFLKKPSECPVDTKILLFRRDCEPYWESWAKSGCFLLQYSTRKEGCMLQLDRHWHRLLFNLVGEAIHGSLIGVSMCKKQKITVVEIWLRDTQAKELVFEKLVQAVPDLTAEELAFKLHSETMRCKSTIKGAKTYFLQERPQ